MKKKTKLKPGFPADTKLRARLANALLRPTSVRVPITASQLANNKYELVATRTGDGVMLRIWDATGLSVFADFHLQKRQAQVIAAFLK